MDESGESRQEEARSEKLHQARRERRSQLAPGRRVELPKPQGGTRPLGMAPGADRGVQTARKVVLEPSCAADVHDCSDGYRAKRDAKPAAIARREDLDNRAWGVVESAVQADFTSIPPGQLLKRSAKRVADGSMLKRRKPTLKVGVKARGQVVPTTVGVPQGAPSSPVYRHSSLHRLDHRWPSRGSPEKRGATLHRDAAEASLVGRRSAHPALAAFAAIATRREVPRNRAKPRVTRGTEGVECIGCNCGKRQSPRSGQNTIAIFPAKSAQQKRRNRLKYLPSRRAPLSPKAVVERVKPMVRGWGNYFRHTNASQAFRGLQRCITIRFRRDLPQRSKGRGVGWTRFPNSTR